MSAPSAATTTKARTSAISFHRPPGGGGAAAPAGRAAAVRRAGAAAFGFAGAGVAARAAFCTGGGCAWKVMVTRPSCTKSPASSELGRSGVSRAPLMRVPELEPRSVTRTVPFSTCTSACRRDTDFSAIWTSATSSRPTMSRARSRS